MLYSLSQNVRQLLSHKQTMHTVDSQCVSHLPTSNYREKSAQTISYLSKNMDRLIPQSTKVDPVKNTTSL